MITRAGSKLSFFVFAIALNAQAAEPGLINVSSPLAREVFQRGPDNKALVRVRLTLPRVGKRINAIVRNGRGSIVLNETSSIEGKAVGSAIEFELSVAATPGMGWHELRLEEFDAANQLVATQELPQIGVGEVFITGGQSNSVASGSARQVSNSDLVSYMDPFRSFFVKFDDALVNPSRMGSPWPIFGSMLAQALGVPVAIVEAGCGGTSIAQWQPGAPVFLLNGQNFCPMVDARDSAHPVVPDADLYRRLVTTAQLVDAETGFRGVLWHQGETDTYLGTSERNYHDLMSSLMRSFNASLGARDLGTPLWFVAQASVPKAGWVRRRNIRTAQKRLWNERRALAGPDTDTLGKEFRSDGLHFNDAGLKAHGKLWFEAVLPKLPR